MYGSLSHTRCQLVKRYCEIAVDFANDENLSDQRKSVTISKLYLHPIYNNLLVKYRFSLMPEPRKD